jgi:hypothetical protein
VTAFWDRWRAHYGDDGLRNPRGDRLLTALAVRALRELRPRLMMVNYQDPDYVHWGNPSHYTRAIQVIDDGLQRLVDTVEADPFYRDNTVFVITPDCGRDANPLMSVPFQHHFNSRAAHETWAVLFGAGIERGRVHRPRRGSDGHRTDNRGADGLPRGPGRGRRLVGQPAVTSARTAPPRALPLRALGLLGGTWRSARSYACTPVTSILALGWITRRMGSTIDARCGGDPDRVGWIMGRADAGLVQRCLGGLAANIETGLRAALGLVLLTLPVTLAWLGAWWAGWENSFNKGYEQSAVGPVVWMLPRSSRCRSSRILPLALAHGAAERRLGAFSNGAASAVWAAAGWRLSWIAFLSVAASALFFARALPTFIEGRSPALRTSARPNRPRSRGRSTLHRPRLPSR